MNLKKITMLLICLFASNSFGGTRHVEIAGHRDPKEIYELYFECIKSRSNNLTLEQAEEECRYILESGIGGFFEEGLKKSIDNSISNLNNIRFDQSYKLIPLAAASSLTIWTILKTPDFYKTLIIKRSNPALMFIPPELFDGFFGNNIKNISIPTFKKFGLSDLQDFLNLSKSEQYAFLIENRDFLAFLFIANQNIEDQKFLILYYSGEAA